MTAVALGILRPVNPIIDFTSAWLHFSKRYPRTIIAFKGTVSNQNIVMLKSERTPL